jgi:hypothetical protein
VATIKAGQTVYTRDGQKHHVREVLDADRVLASPFLTFEDYDGSQEYPSDTASIKLARELYPVAPTAIISAEVTAAREELASVRAEIRESRDALRVAEAERQQKLGVIQRQPSLQLLVDYLEGKITHFLVEEYQHGISVKTWAEFAVWMEDRREPSVKLLSLFGTPYRGVEWWMNSYSDGTGSYTRCQPCLSEEDALQAMDQWLEEAWKDFIPERPWFVEGAVKAADKYGKPVPDHIRKALREHVEAARLRQVEKLKVDLAAAEIALNEARGQ